MEPLLSPQGEILVCEIMRREVAAALVEAGIQDVTLVVFPAQCGRPALNWETVGRMSPTTPSGGAPVCLLGGLCLGGLKPPAPAGWAGCEIARKSVCFEHFLNAPLIHEQLRAGAYLLTPGWLEHWRDHLKQMGFTSETGTAFFHESMKKLVLLDTGTLADSAERLQELAAFLKLPAERIPVGLDMLRLELEKLVADWRHNQEKRRFEALAANARRSAADSAMAYELISELTEVVDEEKVLAHIAQMCLSLFAPSQLRCATVERGQVVFEQSHPAASPSPESRLQEPNLTPAVYGPTPNGTGYRLKWTYRGEMIGWLEMDGFAFPEHQQHYYSLALGLARVFALSINNARNYAKLAETVDELRQEVIERQQMAKERERLIDELQSTLGKVKTLQGLLPICAGCKKIRDDHGHWTQVEAYVQQRTEARFSHGLCPECVKVWFPDHPG